MEFNIIVKLHYFVCVNFKQFAMHANFWTSRILFI